jgi:hypothetical protein
VEKKNVPFSPKRGMSPFPVLRPFSCEQEQ